MRKYRCGPDQALNLSSGPLSVLSVQRGRESVDTSAYPCLFRVFIHRHAAYWFAWRVPVIRSGRKRFPLQVLTCASLAPNPDGHRNQGTSHSTAVLYQTAYFYPSRRNHRQPLDWSTFMVRSESSKALQTSRVLLPSVMTGAHIAIRS